MKRTIQRLLFATGAATIVACSTRPPAPIATGGRPATPPPAPVVVAPPPVAIPVPVQPTQPVLANDQYASRRGDTWFSVARQFNLNPRDLAQWNNAQPDSPLREGQVIRIQGPVSVLPPPIIATPIPVTPPPATNAGPAGDVKREPKAQKTPYSDEAYNRLTRGAATATRASGPTPVAPPTQTTSPGGTLVPAASAATIPSPSAPLISTGPTSETDSISWQWPVTGKVSKKFSEGAVMKGIAVDGKSGTPIYAAAAGRVVYAGEGLRNYGKLVIVRHNDQYTSVYGHNSTINVKEGDSVKRGQKIAEMGNTETDTTRLFFEIRRSGKQVDPEKILPNR
jgi:lipoprotein NlpD